MSFTICYFRNALSLKMLKTLHNNLTSGVDDLRAIILCSTGPVWSAGHDLKELVCNLYNLDVWFQYILGSTFKLCYTLTCCYSISPTSCPITCWTTIEFVCEVVDHDRFYSLLYLQILKWVISISMCRVILMIIYIFKLSFFFAPQSFWHNVVHIHVHIQFSFCSFKTFGL